MGHTRSQYEVHWKKSCQPRRCPTMTAGILQHETLYERKRMLNKFIWKWT